MSDPANLQLITNRVTHDAAVDKAQGSPPDYDNGVPTLIYVSSASNPQCQKAYPKVVELARSHPKVQVYVMEMTAEVTPMIKFGLQNTPVYIMMEGKWCETVLGDTRRMEGIFLSRWGQKE